MQMFGRRMWTLGLITAGVLASGQGLAQGLTKADVQTIVKEYIAANGGAIADSLADYQQREKMAQVAKLIDRDTPTRGPATAPVTVIEFSDYECPFCARVQPTVEALQAKYGTQVRWAFKHLPLDFHPKAKPAAAAAIAAHKQGKFWEFSNKLWQNQDSLTDATFEKIAKELRLDVGKFNTDRASAAAKGQIERDMKDASTIGARGTPYFIINGEGVSGAMPLEAFTQVIDAALAQTKK